jgi:glutamyl-tRNA synthetase
MQITHVIRGEEWLPSAPLHVLLYRALGWENVMPEFAHLPLLLKPDGNGKLSKRDGDRLGFPVFPLEWHDPKSGEISSGYREKGYFPEAFINILVLLGWHSSGNQELFSLDELVQEFSLERVSKAGAKFDPEKAKWFNQQYLRKLSPSDLANAWKPELEKKGIQASDAFVAEVCRLLQEKAHFVNELWSLGNYFFEEPTTYDAEVIRKRWNDKTSGFIQEMSKVYAAQNAFDKTIAEDLFKSTAEQQGLKTGEVMQLFRVCLSGAAGGPALFEMAELLGKEKCAERLKKASESITISA